jgi:hypothetical protein
MRLEAVLPHLRAGGKVKINGIETDLHRLQERNLGRLLSREDFEIVEEIKIIKKEDKMTIDLSTLEVGDKFVCAGIQGEHIVIGVCKYDSYPIWAITFASESTISGYRGYRKDGVCANHDSEFNIVEIIKKEPVKKELVKEETVKEVSKFQRNNKGKPAYSHLDPEFIESMTKVLGANTYKDCLDGKPNWKNEPSDLKKDVLDSLWRHLNALYKGEVIDPTDGMTHASKIAINAMIYNYHKKE